MRNSFRVASYAIALAAGVALSAPASGQSVEDFYKGRTVTWVVGSGPGGTYGVYAQMIAPFISKHLPGGPSIITQFEPAGGGRKAAAYVSSAAPKDGSVISMVQQNVPVFYVLDPRGIRFDVSKWQWIGRMATAGSVLGVWHAAPATTLEDMKRTEIVIGATGTSSETFMNPTLANKFLGTKFKIVTGYRGSRPLFKALEQGEIHGFALSYNSFKAVRPTWKDEGKIHFVLQTGLDSDPEVEPAPIMWQLGETEMERRAMRLVALSARVGRALWAPAGVPKDRVEALRAAFAAAVKDPQFVAETEKRNLPLDPATGQQMEKIASDIFSTDPKVVRMAREALGIARHQ